MGNERYEKGQAIRREVLGDEYVDAAARTTTDFNRPFQELIGEYVWGTLWARPGIDRRTRAMINLGMLTALGRMHEFRAHVRGAVNNGCTTEEIRETLLQATVYCGAPAGLESFREAQVVLDELAAEHDSAPA